MLCLWFPLDVYQLLWDVSPCLKLGDGDRLTPLDIKNTRPHKQMLCSWCSIFNRHPPQLKNLPPNHLQVIITPFTCFTKCGTVKGKKNWIIPRCYSLHGWRTSQWSGRLSRCLWVWRVRSLSLSPNSTLWFGSNFRVIKRTAVTC